MKSILMSIKPKWCELIASGKKTIEIRKTAPKEVPFKAYIYCTRQKVNGEILLTYDKKIEGRNRGFRDNGDIPLAGKVIGEFVCDRVFKLKINSDDYGNYWHEWDDEGDIQDMCLSYEELETYLGKSVGYGLHISELKIYNEPRDIKFKLHKVINGYHKKDEKNETFNDKIESLKHSNRVELKIIDKAPVSWCYVD